MEFILENFHGNAEWVHKREGHAGKAYWPKGQSGVTLDPGVDLGYADKSLIGSLYKPLLSGTQYEAVLSVTGIRGKAAKAALDSSPELKSIRISRETAAEIFPAAAIPYWDAISKRFSTIRDDDTPGSVQTVMLSLAYNRGPGNRELEPLAEPVRKKDWMQVAEIIDQMQQDHALEGIRKRRKLEAKLIFDELRQRA